MKEIAKKGIIFLLIAFLSVCFITACRNKTDQSNNGTSQSNDNVPAEEINDDDIKNTENDDELELGIPEKDEQKEYGEGDTVIEDKEDGTIELIIPDNQDSEGE